MLRGAICASLLGGALVGTPAAAAAIDPGGAASLCTQAVYDYAYYRDELDAAHYGDVFAADSQITFGGRTYAGKPAILAELEGLRAAPSRNVTRHAMSNVRVQLQRGQEPKGTAYVTLYTGTAAAPDAPTPLAGPTMVGVYTIEFKLAGGRCLILRSTLATTFRRAAAPAPARAAASSN